MITVIIITEVSSHASLIEVWKWVRFWVGFGFFFAFPRGLLTSSLMIQIPALHLLNWNVVMNSPEYGQACAHIIRLAVPGLICNQYRYIFWLLLAPWAALGFCLICDPDQHMRWGGESWCDMVIPCPCISQKNSHMCCLWLRNATHLLLVPQGT